MSAFVIGHVEIHNREWMYEHFSMQSGSSLDTTVVDGFD